MAKSKLARNIRKGEQRYIASTPHKAFISGKAIGKYQGVKVGGRKYTRFSQIKTKPAKKITVGQRTARGIGIAIL